MRTVLSGTQHALRAGDYEAVIASVGASLRSLTFDGRDLVVPFDADEVRPSYRGATLAPWPNRVVDGRYTFAGTERQVALTEPARHHALHGLAGWLDYQAIDKGPSHVTLAATIEPQTGYPWRVVVETTFTLGADGVTQSVKATNESPDAAPWGTGPHPYLVAGAGHVDDWTLALPADEVLAVTPDRLIPTGLRAVDADDAERFDFRDPRRINAVEIDHAYTALTRDDAGFATVRVTDRRRLGSRDGVGCRVPVGADPHVRQGRGQARPPDGAGRRADDVRAGCVQRRLVRLRRRPDRARTGCFVRGILADRRDRLTPHPEPVRAQGAVDQPTLSGGPGRSIPMCSPCGTACCPASVAASAGVTIARDQDGADDQPEIARASSIRRIARMARAGASQRESAAEGDGDEQGRCRSHREHADPSRIQRHGRGGRENAGQGARDTQPRDDDASSGECRGSPAECGGADHDEDDSRHPNGRRPHPPP